MWAHRQPCKRALLSMGCRSHGSCSMDKCTCACHSCRGLLTQVRSAVQPGKLHGQEGNESKRQHARSILRDAIGLREGGVAAQCNQGFAAGRQHAGCQATLSRGAHRGGLHAGRAGGRGWLPRHCWGVTDREHSRRLLGSPAQTPRRAGMKAAAARRGCHPAEGWAGERHSRMMQARPCTAAHCQG